jgi:uncharacterized membrane protein (Fun14 family)
MSAVLTPIVYQLGLGAVGGFVVGYAFKKITKIVVIIIGLFVLALIYLGYKGILIINYAALGSAVSGALGWAGQAGDWISPIISHLPFAGSFGLGFFLGFKMG